MAWPFKRGRGKESHTRDAVDDVDGTLYSTSGQYGLKVLHDPQNPTVDIYFIHGLNGNREGTWTWKERGESYFWPRDLLSDQVPHARISTYGYDADYTTFWKMPGKNRIADHAKNLVTDLVNMRDDSGTSSLPIIFVAHSLGGLVLKRALIASKNTLEIHRKQILESTQAIAYLGTPHYGSDKENWASLANKFNQIVKSVNKDIVNVLTPDSEVLAEIESDYSTLIRELSQRGKQDIKTICFFEELEVRAIGFIVPKHAAIIGGYVSVGIPANHMDMTKFKNSTDLGYVRVSSEIRRWIRGISASELREEQSVLLKALSTLYQPKQERIVEPYPSTFQWVWDDQITGLPTWVNSKERNVFWIRGNPGSGKSTLMKYISTNLRDRRIVPPDMNTVVTTFHFDSQDLSWGSAASLLRSISYDILRQIPPSAWEHLPELREVINCEDEYRGDRRQWNFLKTSKLFKSILSLELESITIIVFIDALDECTESLWEFLDLLSILGQIGSCNIRFCISGRPTSMLVESLQNHPGIFSKNTRKLISPLSLKENCVSSVGPVLLIIQLQPPKNIFL